MKVLFPTILLMLVSASMPAVATTSGSAGAPSASTVTDPCVDREVSIASGVAPDYPEPARKLNLGSLVVIVHLTVAANGTEKSASIVRSSGNRDVDFATLVAARKSTYAPAMRDCKPVTGVYNFRANFEPSP